MAKIGPKNFRHPLIAVLGKLAGYEADKSVHHKSLYDDIATYMGIEDTAALGINDATGLPNFEKWVQWAFRWAKNGGLATSPGRGQWALTSEGANLARQFESEFESKNTNDDEVTNDETTNDDGTALEGMVLNLPSNTSIYHEDSYIRRVAAEATSCTVFGWPARGKICQTCPLLADCQNVYSAELSALATDLARKDADAENQEVIETIVDDANEDDDPTPNPQGFDLSKAERIKTRVAAPCEVCGDTINRDDFCWWLQPSQDSDGGLFHGKCIGKE